ncbi:hypothetical protein CLV56_3257 [Mumia flava]|uniref:Uncharacterized protein n=1 Tax=Mumia flava TaxID=1348852 RepID=A0A0B2BT72_9ACTN|nr:hypothetical protein [Mumia flava]PJJ53763.1 hypothetical protein CLV56_3257 [Mumia flava]
MTATNAAVLEILRRRPEWSNAVEKLRELLATHDEEARRSAEEYGRYYEGRRGAMVFDVVASRQRRYLQRVRPLVDQWTADVGEPTLEVLAQKTPDRARYGLRADENVTMSTVATNLLEISRDLSISEDDACKVWADNVTGLEFAPALDPVAGAVRGIGVALFSYLRMRCGASALKPDIRVRRALSDLGFTVPRGEAAILTVAHAAAAELDVDLLTLDQLLWSANDR